MPSFWEMQGCSRRWSILGFHGRWSPEERWQWLGMADQVYDGCKPTSGWQGMSVPVLVGIMIPFTSLASLVMAVSTRFHTPNAHELLTENSPYQDCFFNWIWQGVHLCSIKQSSSIVVLSTTHRKVWKHTHLGSEMKLPIWCWPRSLSKS